jgi:transposase-like protein
MTRLHLFDPLIIEFLFYFRTLLIFTLSRFCFSLFMKLNCPNIECFFYLKHDCVIKDGSYFRKNDSRKIQRYKCTHCSKRFSRETFKLEYYQKKRRINFTLFKLLSSGTSHRRAALALGVNKKTVERRIAYLGQKCRQKNETFLKKQKKVKRFEFDDLITKENSKLKPLSVSVAVDRDSRRILSAQVSKIAAFGHLAKIARKKYGKRKSEHKKALKAMFEELKPLTQKECFIRSDEHQNYQMFVDRYYPKAFYQQFKSERAHVAGQGEIKKVSFDPLFAINHTMAMLRDNIKRLTRRTWCTTKKVERLKDCLDIYIYYHNAYYLKRRLTPI